MKTTGMGEEERGGTMRSFPSVQDYGNGLGVLRAAVICSCSVGIPDAPVRRNKKV